MDRRSRRDTGTVRARAALLAVGLVVGLGGGAGAIGGAPAAVTPKRVQPIMFQLQGPLLDALCPDAIPHPLIGVVPIAEPADDAGTSADV